jgi:hypothetical protein
MGRIVAKVKGGGSRGAEFTAESRKVARVAQRIFLCDFFVNSVSPLQKYRDCNSAPSVSANPRFLSLCFSALFANRPPHQSPVHISREKSSLYFLHFEIQSLTPNLWIALLPGS